MTLGPGPKNFLTILGHRFSGHFFYPGHSPSGALLLEVSGLKTPFILMEGIQIITAFTALPFLPDNDSETVKVSKQLNSARNLKHLKFERYVYLLYSS
jgi:hypothetical protein